MGRTLLASFAVATVTILPACGGVNTHRTSTGKGNPSSVASITSSSSSVTSSSAVTPGSPSSLHDALTLTLPSLVGQGSTFTIHTVQSIHYVQTTAGKALSTQRVLAAATLCLQQWRGVARCWHRHLSVQRRSRSTWSKPGPVYHLVWNLVIKGQPGVLQGHSQSGTLDL